MPYTVVTNPIGRDMGDSIGGLAKAAVPILIILGLAKVFGAELPVIENFITNKLNALAPPPGPAPTMCTEADGSAWSLANGVWTATAGPKKGTVLASGTRPSCA